MVSVALIFWLGQRKRALPPQWMKNLSTTTVGNMRLWRTQIRSDSEDGIQVGEKSDDDCSIAQWTIIPYESPSTPVAHAMIFGTQLPDPSAYRDIARGELTRRGGWCDRPDYCCFCLS